MNTGCGDIVLNARMHAHTPPHTHTQFDRVTSKKVCPPALLKPHSQKQLHCEYVGLFFLMVEIWL